MCLLAVAPGLIDLSSSDLNADVRSVDPGISPSEPLVAYVRDAAKGEVVLMIGTREVVRNDPGLAARLLRSCEV